MADSQEIAVELSEYAALGDWRTLFAYRNRVEKVTTADVQRVAKTFFKASESHARRASSRRRTSSARRSTETPDVAAYVKGIEGGEVKELGEVFIATLDNIEARTKRTRAQGRHQGGVPAEEDARRQGHADARAALGRREVAAEHVDGGRRSLCSMLARGTTKKSYQDLQDAEDQLKAHIWFSTSADGLTLNIDTLRDKLPGAIDLAAEMLKEPELPGEGARDRAPGGADVARAAQAGPDGGRVPRRLSS